MTEKKGIVQADFVLWVQDSLAEKHEEWETEYRKHNRSDRSWWLSGYINCLDMVLKRCHDQQQ